MPDKKKLKKKSGPQGTVGAPVKRPRGAKAAPRSRTKGSRRPRVTPPVPAERSKVDKAPATGSGRAPLRLAVIATVYRYLSHAQHFVVQVNHHDAGPPLGQCRQRLLPHQGFRAAAAHPAEDVAARVVNDRLGAGLGRGRTGDAHHRGQREGAALLPEPLGNLVNSAQHDDQSRFQIGKSGPAREPSLSRADFRFSRLEAAAKA